MKEPEIRCPKCAWRPTMDSRWSCVASCGTEWNTFWTAGLCPGCGRQWTVTQCPKCHARSPHKDWYHFPDDEDETVREETTEKTGA